MNSESKQSSYPYLKKGYFIDYCQYSNKIVECEIISIQNNKLWLAYLHQQYSKFQVEISSERIKPFRTFTSAIQNIVNYHSSFSYWGDRFIQNLQIIKQVNKSPDLLSSLLTEQTVQFWKGRNLFTLQSFSDDKRINQRSCTQQLFEYIKEFLEFLSKFIHLFRQDQCNHKQLYQNQQSALRQSYKQIMIGLSVIFYRKSILQYKAKIELKPFDNIMAYQLQWLNEKLIPYILNKQNLEDLNFYICQKLYQLALKLFQNNLLQRTDKTKIYLQKLTRRILQIFQQVDDFQSFVQGFNLCNDLITSCDKTQFQFVQCLKCKLHLLIKYQDLVVWPSNGTNTNGNVSNVNTPNRGMSQNFLINQKSMKLIKHMSFVLYCFEYPQLIEQVKIYLKHQNGLGYYLKNCSNIPNDAMIKLFKHYPKQMIQECIKNKKFQYLKSVKSSLNYHIIDVAVDTYFKNITGNDREDFNSAIGIHRNLNQQITAIVQFFGVSSQMQSKNKPKIQTSVDTQAQPKQSVDVQKQKQIEAKRIQLQRQKLQQYQRKKVLYKPTLQSIIKLECKLIKLCEILCDTGQKTLTIQYIQGKIIPRYVQTHKQQILQLVAEKQTNFFRQSTIFKALFIKPLFKKDDNESKESLFYIFGEYCDKMLYIKQRQLLQSRKQNIITILSKISALFPEQFANKICDYIESVKKIQNKEFKHKSYQFIQGLLNKPSMYKSEEQKVEKHKQILDCLKIQTYSQFRFYEYLFRTINVYENSLRMSGDQTFEPSVIFSRPYGLQKLYQVIKIKVYDKPLFKRSISFFNKIQFKIIDEQFRRQFIKQISNQLLQTLRFNSTTQKIINEKQKLQQLIQTIQGLMQSHFNNPCINNKQSDYNKIYLSRFHQKFKSYISNNIPSTQEVRYQYIMSLTRGQGSKVTKNNILKIIIKLDQHSLDLKLVKSQQQQAQWKKLVQNGFQLQVDRNQTLYAVKSRSANLFQISPYLSNLYLEDTKIKYEDQFETIQWLYAQYLKKRQQSNGQSSLKQEKLRQQQNSVELNSRQLQGQVQRAQKQPIYLILKQHRADSIVKQNIMENIDLIFLLLPKTKKIWAELNIVPQNWDQNLKLKQLKQCFINCQTQPEAQNQQPSQQVIWWNQITNEPMKRNIIIQILMDDQHLQEYNIKWAFSLLTVMKDKFNLYNNQTMLQFIKKLKPKITHRQVQKILEYYKQSQKYQQSFSSQCLKIYQSVIEQTFNYILENEYKQQSQHKQAKQHVNETLFTFLMKVKTSIFETTHDYQTKFSYRLKLFLENLFINHLRMHHKQFLGTQFIQYIFLYPKNFIFAVQAIERVNRQYENPQLIFNIFEIWLNYCVILFNNKTIIIDKDQPSNNIPLQQIHIRVLLTTISCLLAKNTKCEQITSQKVRNRLILYLSSQLGNQALCVITYIIQLYPSQAQYYISYFIKDINQVQWQKLDANRIYKNNSRHESGYIGLSNPHSICYVNSLMQQLYHIKQFREKMFMTDWKRNQTNINEDLIYQLKKIFINLSLLQANSYFNYSFFLAFKNDQGYRTDTEVQMDVDQFRSILFDRIQNLLVVPQNQKRNFVQQIFNGKQETVIKSRQCQHQSKKQQQFSSICLQVKGLKNLQCALQHYFKAEILNEDNKYLCEDCNKKVDAQKTINIKQYPKYLTFVLKRFQFVIQYRKKINDRFQFPLNQLKMQQNIYKLKGIIVHQGLSQAGHYISLIRIQEKWYQFNDNNIADISQQQVMNLSYGQYNLRSNRNAYLLIYQMYDKEKIEIQNQQIKHNQQIKQYGLDDQIKQIKKYNNLKWKGLLYQSSQFQSFVQIVTKQRVKYSISLLLQYIVMIKSKFSRCNIKNLKPWFQILQKYIQGDFFEQYQHLQWCLKFYQIIRLRPSIKSALTQILVKKYTQFNDNVKKFISNCIIQIHEQQQTSPFFSLLLAFAQKDPAILNFLAKQKIVSRIYEVSISQLLLSQIRQNVAKKSQIPFPLLDQLTLQRKKNSQGHDLRYHKWKLLHFVIESNIQLDESELRNYVCFLNQRKIQSIFEQATTKVNINQISKYFCLLSTKYQSFNDIYVKQICEQISKQKTQNLRKYLKAALDLLNIKDRMRQQRIKLIKMAFSETLKFMHKNKYITGFDIKWKWFLKIGFQVQQFRNSIKQSTDDFRIIYSKQELMNLYRNDQNFEGKCRLHKFYGLKFSSSSTTFMSQLQQKLEQTKKLFYGDQNTIQQIRTQYNYNDTNLTDFPEITLNPKSKIMKFNQMDSKFKQVVVQDVLGDLIQINENQYDKGDQRLMHCLSVIKQNKKDKIFKNQL